LEGLKAARDERSQEILDLRNLALIESEKIAQQQNLLKLDILSKTGLAAANADLELAAAKQRKAFLEGSAVIPKTNSIINKNLSQAEEANRLAAYRAAQAATEIPKANSIITKNTASAAASRASAAFNSAKAVQVPVLAESTISKNAAAAGASEALRDSRLTQDQLNEMELECQSGNDAVCAQIHNLTNAKKADSTSSGGVSLFELDGTDAGAGLYQ